MSATILFLLTFSSVLSISFANLSGPYLFWGPDYLKEFQQHTLKYVEEMSVRKIFNNAKTAVIFTQSDYVVLNDKDYLRFSDIVKKCSHLYLPQSTLNIDFNEFNGDVQITELTGTSSERDTKIAETFTQLEEEYGKGRVLGLVTGPDMTLSEMTAPPIRLRRDVDESTTTSEPEIEEFVYQAPGKALLYTDSAPVLRMRSEPNATGETLSDEDEVLELRSHGLVTTDERGELVRLIVTFGKITLRFRFPLTHSTWSLSSVEFEDALGHVLMLGAHGTPPSAPINFSHRCSVPLVFKNGTTSLTLTNVQVQPALGGRTGFGDVYDCVGFTSVPIWSGIAVSGLLLAGLSIAIIAILDIKPPNKFESGSSWGKQLILNIQE